MRTKLETLRRRAEAGDASAQASLAFAYAEGDGVARNLALAAHWDRRAAAGGNHSARWNLALSYRYGRGVRKNFAKAAALLEQVWRSHASIELRGQAALKRGWLFHDGLGGKADDLASRRWHRRSARLGWVRPRPS